MDICRKESVNRSHEQQKPMRKVEDERRGPHNGRRENVLPTIRQDANHIPLSKRNHIPLSQLSATSSKSAKMSIDMEYSRSTSSSGSGIPSNSIRDIVHSIASCRKPRTSLNTNSPKAEDLANNRKAIKSRKTASIQPVVKTLNRGIIGLRLDPSSYISSSSSSSANLDDDTSSKNIDQNRRDAGTYKMVESQIIKSSTNSNDIDQSQAKTILFDDNTSDVPSKSLTHSFDLTPSKSMASIDNESNGFMPSIQSPVGDKEWFVVNDANNARVDETRVTMNNSQQSVEGLPKETTQVITSSKNEEESHRYVEEECNSNMPAESVITIDKCHNPARPDEENDPISSREKETNCAHTAMPSAIPDNSTVGESFVINTRSVDSDQAVHQEIIESMSSLTLEEFSVPTYEGLKHYQSSPSIIKNSNTLNRSIQTGATHVGGLPRPVISDAPKIPQNAVSGVKILQPIPSSTMHQYSHETMAAIKHGYSAPWNSASQNLLSTQASGIAGHLCTSLRPSMEISHDPMLYPRHTNHYNPYTSGGPPFESNLHNDHYTLTNNSQATGLPIKLSIHPHEVNTQIRPMISLPQPQSCISSSYDCAHSCQCSHCTGYRLNSLYNNLCPMVVAPSDMLRNSTKATFVSNSLPLHEMSIFREKVRGNHNLMYPYHPLTQAHVLHSKGVPDFEGQCAYRRADDTREIRKSPLPISSRMDTTQIMSDNIAAGNSARDYHDRLKTRKCFDPTRNNEISASINTCRNHDDISQVKLQQSEEKIHALQRVLHLAKAQHECLLEERNQRQVGRY